MEIAEYLDRKIYNAIASLYIDIEQRVEQLDFNRSGTWSINQEAKWRLMNIITAYYCYKVIMDIYFSRCLGDKYKDELDKTKDLSLAVDTMISDSPWNQIADYSITKLFEYNFEDDFTLAIIRFQNIIKDFASSYIDFAENVLTGPPRWLTYFDTNEIEYLQSKILKAIRLQSIEPESFFGPDWEPPYYTKLGPTLLYVPDEDRHLIE